MKAKNLSLRGVVTVCIMLALGSISNLSMAGEFCSRSALAGNWSFSEDGELPGGGGAWSEIGSFTLNSSGIGSGVAIITAVGIGLVNVEVPLNPLQIDSFNKNNCIGTASFTAGEQVRTIRFTVGSNNSAFDYISTVGDLTITGHAIKRVVL